VTNNKSFKLAAGIFGIATGVLGGVLLARKLRQESREEFIAKIRDIFGIYNEEFRDKYYKVKDAVEKKVLLIKSTGESIDQEKYTAVIDKIVDDFKNSLALTNDNAEKLVKHLKKDWVKLTKSLS